VKGRQEKLEEAVKNREHNWAQLRVRRSGKRKKANKNLGKSMVPAGGIEPTAQIENAQLIHLTIR
jgi:hypothetical protein